MPDKLRWVKIADYPQEIQFPENGIAAVNAEGKTICLAKQQDGFYAFAYKCPHAGGYFANGFIDAAGNVVCPLHRYKFCLKNGRNVSGEGYYLKTWPVRVSDEGVFVGFEKNKLFGLL